MLKGRKKTISSFINLSGFSSGYSKWLQMIVPTAWLQFFFVNGCWNKVINFCKSALCFRIQKDSQVNQNGPQVFHTFFSSCVQNFVKKPNLCVILYLVLKILRRILLDYLISPLPLWMYLTSFQIIFCLVHWKI